MAAYIFHDEKLLLLRRANPPFTLAPPGGRLEGDEDPLVGLHREIHEETGLEAEVLGVAHVWFGSVDGVQPPLLCINYLAQSDKSNVRLSNEHSEYGWVTRLQLERGDVQTLTGDGNGYRPEHILAAFDLYETLRRPS